MEKNLITQPQAEEIFKRYIALLYRLAFAENNDFDLIIGAGDSGAFMARTAEIFFIKEKREIPVIYLPIQRYTAEGEAVGKYFDNSVLLPRIRENIQNLKKIEKVLFVDDEIWKAWAAKETIRLILGAADKNKIANYILYTIIAEHHGFEWHYTLPPVAIKFYSFSKKIPGVNGSIFEIISDEAWNKFKKYKKDLSKKQLANLFLNGIIKASGSKEPEFSKELGNKLLKIASFKEAKKDIKNRIEYLIDIAINEYKSGKISFLF